MAVLPKIGWTAMYLPFLYYALASSAVCNSEVYGSPNQQDCAQALRNIPFATSGPSSPSSLQSHIFAEPQYMDPPFGGIDNMFPSHAIVQLPKIWKRSTFSPIVGLPCLLQVNRAERILLKLNSPL